MDIMATEEKPSKETPDQLVEEISNRIEIPATYEPPSPLTGCYLLIILGEPHSQEHKDIILQRLLKGLLSWNVLHCHVDLEEELKNLTNQAPEGEAARHGERLIQFASENLVTEILIHPQYNTLIQCMRNLLSSFTRHRHIIHSGYTFSGNGSWILQDATFSVSDFSEALQDYEVQRVLRAYPDTISMEIHCATSGHWNKLPEKSYAKLCKIRINSVDILDSGSEQLNAFINYLSPLIAPASLNELMESSDVVGNIRFSHPTLYVFPGGQGDAALFGINGFNMLVDGGFNRKSCFWDFTRHLDRLDAVLMTRINNANIQGLSSIIERKAISNVYPQLGYFFTNIPESKPEPSLESDKDSDPLLVNLFERGQSLTSNLKSINLKPQPCYKDIEPINLYHKVGHGTLDMYVISPSKESKEVKEFLQKWNARDQNLFANKQSKEFQFPLQNLVSICAMLVWQPSNPEETITRLLFPGSTPDYKILEGLDKMKHLEFVKHPVCTANKIEATFSSTILSKKQLKSALADKSTHEPILPSKVTRNVVAQEKDNKMVTETKSIIKTEKENNVADETENNETKVIKLDEKEPEKDNKIASESKPIVKSRIDTRPPKSLEKKLKKDSSTEKKSSPITTPKKETKQQKEKEKEREIRPKVISRVAKTSPSSTPAKSTKEANNRKVLESKQRTVKTVKKEVSQLNDKKENVKELKVERKAISRRPKPAAGSPMKSVKKANSIRKPKSDKGVASDSSVVSTPSADDVKVKKIAEQEKQILLDDLIEEQEAVREIEAVLQRSESKQISDEHRAIIDKQDSTTEADEDEEYIIIEKEEQYTEDSVNEPESTELTGKEEVKHQRDSQESEKKRKPSIETTEEELEEEPHQPADQDKSDGEKAAELDDIKIEGETIPTAHKMNGDIQKPKAEEEDEKEEAKSDEGSPITDEKQPSSEKKIDVKEELGVEKIGDAKETDVVNIPESQATAESGATTAPTLPEDEHITLDEIKENVVIEEKYIKEETKETQVVVTTVVDEPIDRIQPKPMQFDAQQPHLRELNIKTPDEVADLPVHEEADIGTDETPAGSRKASLRKGEEPEKKAHTELIRAETKDNEENKSKEDEKHQEESKTPLEKKSPSPTSVEPRIQKTASPVEKVEYKVEDLGEQFESTLKDVTGKVEVIENLPESKTKSPVAVDDDGDRQATPVEDISAKDVDDERKSLIDDVKQKQIDLIEQEKTENKAELFTEHAEETKSVTPDKISTERKISDVDESGDVKLQTVASKSPSPEINKEICANQQEIQESEFKNAETEIKATVTEITTEKSTEMSHETSESPSTTKGDIEATKVEEIEGIAEEVKSSSPKEFENKPSALSDQDTIETKEEKVETMSLSQTVSPVPETDIQTKASPDSKRASLVDDSEVNAHIEKPSEQAIDLVEKSPISDEQICESSKQNVGEVDTTELIDRKSVSPSAQEQIVLSPTKDDITSRKDSFAASEYTEVYDYSHPFDAQCSIELRETHITTVELPIVEKSKLIDLQVIDKTITEIVEGDDLSLNDIKEEDEEERVTPPREEIKQPSPKPNAPLEVQTEASRSVSPREQEVLKIVANVAEVLKSEKDITDIIPDFNEDELEKNILQRASTPEVFSTIKESTDFHDLSASLSEAKTSNTSIDEKEQHEIAEKHQTGFQKETTEADVARKESYVSEVLDDSRRESAISTFSEKDFTKDESTLDKFSRSNSSLELKHDELEAKSSEIGTHSDDTKIENSEVTESVTTESRRESLLKEKAISVSPERTVESKSPTFDDTHAVLEQESTEKADFELADKPKLPPTRKESVSLKLEEDSTTVQRMLVTASSEDGGEETEICAEGTIKFSPSATTPEGKATPEVVQDYLEKKTEHTEQSHIESTLDVDDLARRESTSQQSDRPDSVMSHFSDTTEPELKETCSSPEKHVQEKLSSSSGKSTGSPSAASSSHGSVEIEGLKSPSDQKGDSAIAKIDEKSQEKADKNFEAKPIIEDEKKVATPTDISRPESADSDKKIDASQAIKPPSPLCTKVDSLKKNDDDQLITADISRSDSAVKDSQLKEEQKTHTPPSKEDTITKPESRSQSVASVVSEEKIEVAKAQESHSQSIASETVNVSGKSTPVPDDRPESVASDKKSDGQVIISKSPPDDSKEDSLERAASRSQDDTLEPTSRDTKSSTPSAEKETVVDIKSITSTPPSPPVEKRDFIEKVDTSQRPESVASDISLKDGQKSSSTAIKEEQIETKVGSRSQSVASAVSEEKFEITEAHKSRSQSIVSEKQDISGKSTPNQESRPESAASSDKKGDGQISTTPAPSSDKHYEEKDDTKTPISSTDVETAVSTDKLDAEHLKSDSRPESRASQGSLTDEPKSIVPQAKKEETDQKEPKTSQTPPHDETSRPTSRFSVESIGNDSPIKRDDEKLTDAKSHEYQIISPTDESKSKTPQSPSHEETSSRPASHVSVESTGKVSPMKLEDEKLSDDKPPKDQTISATNESEELKKSQSLPQETSSSRPASRVNVESTGHVSPIKLEEEKLSDDKSNEDQIINTTDESKEPKTSQSPSLEDTSSRPASRVSVESVGIDSTMKREDEKSSEDIQKSRSHSVVSEKADSLGKTTPSPHPESVDSAKEAEDTKITAGELKSCSPSPKDELIEEESTSSKVDSIVSAIDVTKDSESTVKEETTIKTIASELRSESIVSSTIIERKDTSPSPPEGVSKPSSRPESRVSDEKENFSPTPSTKSDDKIIGASDNITIKNIAGDTSPSPPESVSKPSTRPESLVSDENKSPSLPESVSKPSSRPESRVGSEKEHVSPTPSTKSDDKITIEHIAESHDPTVETIKEGTLEKADEKEVQKSRPTSAASGISSKDEHKTQSVTEERTDSPSAFQSVKRDSLEKFDDQQLSGKQQSRPESAASDISSKKPTTTTVESRSQSVASVASEEKYEITEAHKSHSQSIVSEKQDISGKSPPHQESRPESAASSDKKDDGQISTTPPPSNETQFEKADVTLEASVMKEAEKEEKDEKDSDLDAIGVQIATGSTICNIYDSADKKTGDKGPIEDKFVANDLPKKTDIMKESRSKSVASISLSGPASTSQSINLEKITEVSKDDSNLAGSSRKASDISTLIEDVKKMDEKIVTLGEKFDSNEVTTTTTITKEETLSSSQHKLSEQKSAHSSLESTTSDKGSFETVLDKGVAPSGDIDTKDNLHDLPAATKETTSSIQVVTKEISTIKSESKTYRDSDNESLPISDDEAITSSQKYSYEDYQFERSNSELSKKSDLDIDDSQNDIPPQYGSQEYKSAVTVSSSYAMDPMSASFYGELPSGLEKSEPTTTVTTVRTVVTKQFDAHGKPIDDHKFFDEADMGFEKALEEHRQARGADVMSSITSKYEFSPSKFPADKFTETESSFPLSDVKSPKEQSKSEAASSAEVLARQLEDDLKKAEERVASWGKPLGLPVSSINDPPTPKRERKIASAKIKLNNEKNIQKRANSPNKNKKSSPIYMDLAYVPHNGNSYYSHVEFFKRVRARYYVFSGTEPSRDVYNALLEAKQTWEDKSLEVTIIPTYDTDVLGYWVAENEELLAKYHIDLSPSASRCTINLQDHETCCSAYRLEF